ncbi:GNAT family N-acetyltransferase [Roseibium polysiphoniae]|uniref:GNAT family N-acetyltransferase n=1 Tax=Roseibium polysiphoniae TaxID=2571221 RepID=UPI0032994F2A
MSDETTRLEIRPAVSQDYEVLRDLFTHLIPNDLAMTDDRGRAALNGMLSHPGLTTLIGFHDGVAAATCTLIVIPNFTRGGAPYAVIENVVTRKDYRGKGLGEQILRHAQDLAWASGSYKVMLLTGADNHGAQRFYEKVGFKQSKTGYQIRAPGYPKRAMTE